MQAVLATACVKCARARDLYKRRFEVETGRKAEASGFEVQRRLPDRWIKGGELKLITSSFRSLSISFSLMKRTWFSIGTTFRRLGSSFLIHIEARREFHYRCFLFPMSLLRELGCRSMQNLFIFDWTIENVRFWSALFVSNVAVSL